MCVGEAPGAQEDKLGRPFVGGSGELLNQMLSAVGILRSECFITNVCHVRPPENDFDHFFGDTLKPHLQYGILQLKEDIESIRPNVVVAFGRYPMHFLTGKGLDPGELTKWRGSIVRSTLVSTQKVISTYHPAFILRNYDYKVIGEFDLGRVKEESAYPDIRRPDRQYYLDPPPDVRMEVAREMLNAEWLAVDIECVPWGTGWKLSCIGFSDRASRAMVIPIRNTEDVGVMKLLCESDVKKVFQNGMFDVTVLRQNGVEVKGFVWDTMYGHHALFTECASGADEMSALTGKKRQSAIQKGLAFQTSIYTKEPFYKDDSKLSTATNDDQLFWLYNGRDACVTREIRDVQEKELAEFGTRHILDHEMSLVEPLLAMTARGVKVDPEAIASLRAKVVKELEALQSDLDDGFGGPVNVKSPKQVTDILYKRLGLPVIRNAAGNPTGDADALVALAAKYGHPQLHRIIAVRERRDLIERYLDAKYDSDGRMRCAFDPTGTRTGRLASRQSLSGSGTNLQTIPDSLRRMFVADSGYCFYYIDLSQAEARVVAHLAQEEELIALFSDPTRDAHRENAARIFGKKPDEVTGEERYLAKRVLHASNYGMGPGRLVEIINADAEATGIRTTPADAKLLMDGYFMLYPKIREVFWKEVRDELQRSRTLVSPLGRKRIFFGRWGDKFLREAYAYKPQSCIGDLLNMGLVAAYHRVPKGQLLLNVHDAVLGQARLEDIEEVIRDTQACMNIPLTIKGRTFTIPSDVQVGANWGHADEENPHGLRKVK